MIFKVPFAVLVLTAGLFCGCSHDSKNAESAEMTAEVNARVRRQLEAETPTQESKGRYSLVPAAVENIVDINGAATSAPQNELFKIDTATGRTWVYSSIAGTNGFVRQWIEMPNPKE